MTQTIAKSSPEKQRERYAALKAAALAAGWSSWAAYCTAVIHGRVRVARLPRRWINARGKRKSTLSRNGKRASTSAQ